MANASYFDVHRTKIAVYIIKFQEIVHEYILNQYHGKDLHWYFSMEEQLKGGLWRYKHQIQPYPLCCIVLCIFIALTHPLHPPNPPPSKPSTLTLTHLFLLSVFFGFLVQLFITILTASWRFHYKLFFPCYC